jgi:RsiW-degrading membrane proteinase PrsW (M82 family)
MNYFLLLLLSVFPVIALLLYFERQDKGRKEPMRLKWKVFKWGIYAAVFAGVIEINIDWGFSYLNMPPMVYAFLSAFFMAALVEESLKLWVVKKEIFKDEHFDEIMDGISYAILASLGFAMLENVLYVMQEGFAVGIIRALLSVPGHAMFSGVMGYYIGKAKVANTPWASRSLLWKGLGFAILYHGSFNFILSTENELIFLVIPLLIIMGIHLKHKIKQARYEDKVDGIEPEKLTIGRIIKAIIGVVLILIATGSFIGSIFLANDPAYNYSGQDIIYSAIFAAVLYLISYFFLRKKVSSQIYP